MDATRGGMRHDSQAGQARKLSRNCRRIGSIHVRAFLVAMLCLAALTALARAQPRSPVQRPSCDLGQCINICLADRLPGDDCVGHCSKIISLCTQIVMQPERARFGHRKLIEW
jgi:hypothetical protein